MTRFHFKQLCFKTHLLLCYVSPQSCGVASLSGRGECHYNQLISLSKCSMTSAGGCFDTPVHFLPLLADDSALFVHSSRLSVFPLLPFRTVSSRSAVLCGWSQQERDRRRRRHRGSEERTLREWRWEGTVHPQNLPSKEARLQNKLRNLSVHVNKAKLPSHVTFHMKQQWGQRLFNFNNFINTSCC